MGYLLYREVKRYAPDDLDTGELALLLILADEANDDTHECFPGMDELCAYMRLSAEGVRRILQRLAKRGIEVRVPIGKDNLGRPVYAQKGSRTTYHLPRFAPTGDSEGGTAVPPMTPQSPDAGTAFGGERRDAGTGSEPQRRYSSTAKAVPASRPSPQFPHEEDPHLLPAQRILRAAGLALGDEDEKRFIDWTNRDNRKGPAWWRTLAANGDLSDLVAQWRTEAAQPSGAHAGRAESRSVGDVLTGRRGGTDPCGKCDPHDRRRELDGRIEPCPVCNAAQYASHADRRGDKRGEPQRLEDDWNHENWLWEQDRKRGVHRPRPVNAPDHLYEGLL